MTQGLGDLSVAELVSRATQQISTLVRDEFALAKAELMEKGKRAGQGVGLFAVIPWMLASVLFGVYAASFRPPTTRRAAHSAALADWGKR